MAIGSFHKWWIAYQVHMGLMDHTSWLIDWLIDWLSHNAHSPDCPGNFTGDKGADICYFFRIPSLEWIVDPHYTRVFSSTSTKQTDMIVYQQTRIQDYFKIKISSVRESYSFISNLIFFVVIWIVCNMRFQVNRLESVWLYWVSEILFRESISDSNTKIRIPISNRTIYVKLYISSRNYWLYIVFSRAKKKRQILISHRTNFFSTICVCVYNNALIMFLNTTYVFDGGSWDWLF